MYLILLPWGILLVAIILFGICLFLINKQKRQIEELENMLQSLLASNIEFKKELCEIHSGAVGMGKKMLKLDSVIQSTQENQFNLAAQTPENRLYSRATKMVELGATLEEVMIECELPKAEAELLMNLHTKMSS
jgi:hypothetical protein